jgi:hypothetical protein
MGTNFGGKYEKKGILSTREKKTILWGEKFTSGFFRLPAPSGAGRGGKI